MNHRFPTRTLLPLLLVATACAPRATRGGGEAEVPRLVGCSGFQNVAPGVATRNFNNFLVTVRVAADGKVVPGSGQVDHRGRGTADAAQRARSMAESCSFEPATRNGSPMEAQARVRVVFPSGEA